MDGHSISSREVDDDDARTVAPLDSLELDDLLARTVLEQVPDGLMITDEDGRIRLVNHGLEEIFGYDRAEILGQHLEILVPEDLHSRHRAHRLRYRAAPHRRPMGAGIELDGRRKDGSHVPVEISLSPMTTDEGQLTIATIRDVTARRAAEHREMWVQRLLDATSDAVFVFDLDALRFVHVNEGACRQTGYPRDELETMGPLHVLPDLPERRLRAALEPLTSGAAPRIEIETVIRNTDGTDIPVEVVCELIQPDPDQPSVYVATSRDIRERLAGKKALDDAERRLAVSEDRERIARDLHDKVIQRLFGTGLGLQSAALHVEDAPVRERLHTAIDDLDEAIREIRTSIFALHAPSQAGGPQLRAQILERTSEASRILGFSPSVQFVGPIDAASTGPLADALLATLQEALSNVARHARATDVHIEVTVNDVLELLIRDDGVGVSPTAFEKGGSGLRNMRDRAVALGGLMQVVAIQPSGTQITWQVPLPE